MSSPPVSNSVKPELVPHFTPAGGLSEDPVERLREKIENLKIRLGQIEAKRAEVETTLSDGSGNATDLEKDRIALLEDSLETHRKLTKKMDDLNKWELKIAAVSKPLKPKAQEASGIKEFRKIKPEYYREGMDICTFFDRFKDWVRISEFKTDRLDELMLTMIKDNNTWQQLKNVTLLEHEKSDADLLVKAYLRYLHPETETGNDNHEIYLPEIGTEKRGTND